MGAFFTNYQVRSDSADDVARALKAIDKSVSAYISPTKNGWVTIYEKESDSQDDAVLQRLAMALSRGLSTAVFAFVVHDSDILMYWLYERGQLADEYNSAPDYFGDADEETRERYQGNPDALLPLCQPGTTREAIAKVMDPDSAGGFAEETLGELATLLGIDPERAALGFNYFEEEPEVVADSDQYLAISGPARKGRRKAKPKNAAAEMEGGLAAGGQAEASVPEMYEPAVVMIIGGIETAQKFNQMPKLAGQDRSPFNKALEVAAQKFRQGARQFLKMSRLPHRPTDDELFAAADNGLPALAALIAAKTPDRLDGIAALAANSQVGSGLKALLDVGASPNAIGTGGSSALSCAAAQGAAPVVKMFLERGADPNRANDAGITPLMMAVQRNAEVTRLLIDAGADVNARDSHGHTALFYARAAEIVDLLKAAGAGE